jgi:hypothetical protein
MSIHLPPCRYNRALRCPEFFAAAKPTTMHFEGKQLVFTDGSIGAVIYQCDILTVHSQLMRGEPPEPQYTIYQEPERTKPRCVSGQSRIRTQACRYTLGGPEICKNVPFATF